jgi:hypothetical protein
MTPSWHTILQPYLSPNSYARHSRPTRLKLQPYFTIIKMQTSPNPAIIAEPAARGMLHWDIAEEIPARQLDNS